MDTIQLNGKDYVNKADVEQEYIKRTSIEEEYVLKNSVEKQRFEDLAINLTDEATVMGMGSCKLAGDWKVVKISIDYLERAIKALKLMTYDKKREAVVIAVSKDYPLCLGDIKQDKFSGIIIAPRVESE